MNALIARILGRPEPLSPRQAAQLRLEQIVEATRHSYACERFRRAREAALKGRGA
jgi:hypothetical protein